MAIPSRHDYKGGHSIELLRSGENFFAACEKTIDEAKHYIHFQTYIVDDDETGRRIVNALDKSFKRGVRVYFLLDAYGGNSFSKELINRLKKPGSFSGCFLRDLSPKVFS